MVSITAINLGKSSLRQDTNKWVWLYSIITLLKSQHLIRLIAYSLLILDQWVSKWSPDHQHVYHGDMQIWGPFPRLRNQKLRKHQSVLQQALPRVYDVCWSSRTLIEAMYSSLSFKTLTLLKSISLSFCRKSFHLGLISACSWLTNVNHACSGYTFLWARTSPKWYCVPLMEVITKHINFWG